MLFHILTRWYTFILMLFYAKWAIISYLNIDNPDFIPQLSSNQRFLLGFVALITLIAWPFVTYAIGVDTCKKYYFKHIKEDFIWQRDRNYYNAFIKDDGILTIEEWKPLRYAYYTWTTETPMDQPFKIWYRNKCKRLINFDKYCKLRNHLVC